MNGQYAYTPYIWPMLASAAFTTALAIYAWRRRSVPGALPFAVAMLSAVPHAGGAALQLAAVEVPAKIFWFKFQAPWILFATTVVLCFGLEYANLGHWLTRRSLALLAIPVLILFLLVPTNDAHHWMWLSFSFDGYIRPVYGIGTWILIGYGYLLVLLYILILFWLFLKSPLHRWPVALMLLCRLATSTAYWLGISNRNPFAPMDPVILTVVFTSGVWAFALFQFRIFDPVPLARQKVIEQMQEGMLVLDMSQKVVDLNPAAEKILGLPAARLRGRDLAEVLPVHAEMSAYSNDGGATQFEVSLGNGAALRTYVLNPSPLKDRRNRTLGYLLLLHDVTEQKRAQAQLMEHQRAVAALKEREQVARELHDELAQELAFINAQAQAANESLTAGDSRQAGAYLARLAEVARETHADVREQISTLSLSILPEEGFTGALHRFLEAFSRTYGIQGTLILPANQAALNLEPSVEIQLLRIVQEAFTNIRKHAHAQHAQVSVEITEAGLELIVADDGRGFDSQKRSGNDETFGLRIMRERAAEIGGGLQVQSEAGCGTRVIVRIPR